MTRVSLGEYYWGLGASLLTLLAGGWLILAPFALGYQAGTTGGWTDMTQNDFWVGCGLVLIAVAGLVFFTRGLVAALRAAGVVRARPRPHAKPQPAAAAPAAAPATLPARPQLEQTMALLAEALAADLAERRKTDTEHKAELVKMGG
jgi:hypothetical protein